MDASQASDRPASNRPASDRGASDRRASDRHWNLALFGYGLIGLSAVVAAHPQAYLFGKIMSVPGWAPDLPFGMGFHELVGFAFLAPIAWLSRGTAAALRGLLFCLLLTPLPALLRFAADPGQWHSGLPINLAFNYLWIQLSCVAPALAVLVPRLALALGRRLRRGRTGANGEG
ncbi:hypothetical protein ABU614_07945 [Lysobacter firmicutimachus]|uniref:DoxX family protein n=1 Tax=Lysobacter firmicutimachus TaxID=1792846 RepID=A0AAU8MYB2_9GAMM